MYNDTRRNKPHNQKESSFVQVMPFVFGHVISKRCFVFLLLRSHPLIYRYAHDTSLVRKVFHETRQVSMASGYAGSC